MPTADEIGAVLQDRRGLLLSSCRYCASEIFGYVIHEHHDRILSHYERSQTTLDLAPRGCGKSRIGDIAYAFWRALQDPDIRILIVSDTDQHATNFLKTIKAAFEFSPVVREEFGDVRGPVWTDHALTLKGRTRILTEATITALGAYSGAVTSGHYDVIICDDLVNFENARTEGKRERMKTWFKMTLLPTLIPGGEVHVVGTRYHFQDLYQMIMDDLGYSVQVQEAIQTDAGGEERSIWEEYMPLEDREDPVTGAVVEGLRAIREKIGSVIFALQYQNDVELLKAGDIFRFDWFRWYSFETRGGRDLLVLDDGEEVPLEDLEIYAGCDPAVGETDRNDYFVIATIGVLRPEKEPGQRRAPPPRYFVLDILRDRPTYEGRAAAVDAMWHKWRPRVMAIEDVAFQKEFCQRIRSTFLYIRVQEVNPGTKDKTSRAYSRSGLVEAGRVYVRKGQTLFVEELCTMPDGEHDDQFDAFDHALSASGAPRSGLKQTSLKGGEKYQQAPPAAGRRLFEGTTRKNRSWNDY